MLHKSEMPTKSTFAVNLVKSTGNMTTFVELKHYQQFCSTFIASTSKFQVILVRFYYLLLFIILYFIIYYLLLFNIYYLLIIIMIR